MNSVNLTGQPGAISDADQARINRPADTGRGRENAPVAPAGHSNSTAGDVISVSDEAAAIARLAERAGQLPEIGQEKVDQLREQIRSGSFRPKAEEIADAMLKSEQ